MSIYQKQIESERLNNEVEAWLAKNQITNLPMGFSNFPDGRLPVAKGNPADKKLTESESLERIELVNQRVRELQARKEERWKQQEQAKAEARVQRELAKKEPSVETLRRSEVMSLSKQAIARGERIFTAPCAKHGYTSYRIYGGVSRCLECKLKLNREYLDPKLDQVQLDRRERAIFNNERMDQALSSGTNLFEGLCRVHGYTEFRAHKVESRNKNEFRCMACSKASQKKFNQKRGVQG